MKTTSNVFHREATFLTFLSFIHSFERQTALHHSFDDAVAFAHPVAALGLPFIFRFCSISLSSMSDVQQYPFRR